eukprot:6212547-Pleurochrysis_carterae.AAC.3
MSSAPRNRQALAQVPRPFAASVTSAQDRFRCCIVIQMGKRLPQAAAHPARQGLGASASARLSTL